MPLVPEALLESVANRFRVLGDATRLSLLQVLISEGECNVGTLVERLRMSQANVSKHLRVLLDAGMVERRAEGTAAYYRAVDPTLAPLCELVCGRIRDQVEAQAAAFR